MSAFLSDEDLVKLTGRYHKSKQIEWLRGAGIAFHVAATGHPSVLWSAIDNSRSADPAPQAAWKPRVMEQA